MPLNNTERPRQTWLQKLAQTGAVREAILFLVFLGLTVVMTWPWAAYLRYAVSDPGDPYFFSWALWWDYHQTFHDPLNLFHANILFPYRYTLAFAENLYGIALICFPLFALGLRPLTVHAVAILLGFAFSGYGAFRLTRTLAGSNGVAWVTGVAFAFIPYRFHQLPHVGYLFCGWIPILLEALVLFMRQPAARRAAWMGTAFFMNALTSVHWFVLTLIPLALSFGFLLVRYRNWGHKAFWLRGFLALAGASILLTPFLLPYARASEMYGFVRPAEETRHYSAAVINWFVGDSRNKIWHGLNDSLREDGKDLFPGLLIPLFVLASIFLVKPRTQADEAAAGGLPRWRRLLMRSEAFWLGVVWMVTGFLCSLGMNFSLYRTLYKYVPLFRAIRAPERAAMICYLGAALLAGLGARRLIELLSRHWSAVRPVLGYAVIVSAILFELRAAPLSFFRGAVDPDALTLRLRDTPMKGGIVELPYGDSDELIWHAYSYVLRAADHGRPLITATSGFVPPIQTEIKALVNRNLIPDRFLDLLESIPCSYLVIHKGLLEPGNQRAIQGLLSKGMAGGRLRFVASYDDADLYAVTKIEPE